MTDTLRLSARLAALCDSLEMSRPFYRWVNWLRDFREGCKGSRVWGQVVRCRVIRVDREAKSMAVSLRKTDNVKNLSKRKATETTETAESKRSPRRETKSSRNPLRQLNLFQSLQVPLVHQSLPRKLPSLKSLRLLNLLRLLIPTKPAPKAVLPSLRQLEEEELAKEEMLMSVRYKWHRQARSR